MTVTRRVMTQKALWASVRVWGVALVGFLAGVGAGI